MRIASVIFILVCYGHLTLCRNNSPNDSKSERRRHPSRLRGNINAKIIKETVGPYNTTDKNNNTLSIVNSITNINIETTKLNKRKNSKGKNDLLICPLEKQAPFQLIPTLCRRNRDCKKSGSDMKCCNLFGSKRCVKGVRKALPEPPHDPIFGIPRKCPQQPLTETFWEIKTCETDADCWPRVCCPDGDKRYCRTSQPLFEQSENAAARQLAYPVEAVSQYLQCTPAPPVIFDLHPKSCNTTLDCFPNLCCQESGNRYCRPPKRSLLTFVAGLTSGKLTVVPIHHNQELLEECVLLINSEWPRSFSARLWSLKASRDSLPTSLVMIEKGESQDTKPTVLAHAKLSVIPSDQEAVFIESVVVDSRRRGQGLGRQLMASCEHHCFGVLKLKTIYLSTIDKQAFYSKLGYVLCNAISIFGTRSALNNSTKKIWMKKTLADWLQSTEQ